MSEKFQTTRHKAVFAALAASVAVTGCGIGMTAPSVEVQSSEFSHCDSVQEITYQYYDGNIINMQATVANKEGFFAEACLLAKPVRFNNTPSSIAGTVSGEVNFINSGTDNLPPFRAQGIEVEFIATNLNKPYYSFVVAEDKMEDSLEETLAGLNTLGVTTIGGSNEFHGRTFVEGLGGDPDEYTWIGMGDVGSMVAGLENGTVDAVTYFGTTQDIAVATGHGVMVSDPRVPAGPDNPVPEDLLEVAPASMMWGAQSSFLEQNPDVAHRFVAALSKASEWAADPANRADLYAHMDGEINIPDSVAGADEVFRISVDTYADMLSTEIDMDAVQAYIDYTADVRSISLTETAEDIIWEEAQ